MVQVEARAVPVRREGVSVEVHFSVDVLGAERFSRIRWHVGQPRRLGYHPGECVAKPQLPSWEAFDLEAALVHQTMVTPAE